MLLPIISRKRGTKDRDNKMVQNKRVKRRLWISLRILISNSANHFRVLVIFISK
jgi:hypothetical protein